RMAVRGPATARRAPLCPALRRGPGRRLSWRLRGRARGLRLTVLTPHPPPDAEHRVQGLRDDVGVALLRQQTSERGRADREHEGVVLHGPDGGAHQESGGALLAV